MNKLKEYKRCKDSRFWGYDPIIYPVCIWLCQDERHSHEPLPVFAISPIFLILNLSRRIVLFPMMRYVRTDELQELTLVIAISAWQRRRLHANELQGGFDLSFNERLYKGVGVRLLFDSSIKSG